MGNLQENDVINLAKRSVYEAEQGRIHEGLSRLEDAIKEYPDKSILHYARGMFYRDHLGQGVEARKSFIKAYKLKPDPVTLLSIICLCSDEHEFKQWLSTLDVKGIKGEIKNFPQLQEIERGLSQDYSLSSIYLSLAEAASAQGGFGVAAVYGELAIETGDLDENEIDTRGARATVLRKLDVQQNAAFTRLEKVNPPENRPALVEAVTELSKYLEYYPNKAETWNNLAAWHVLLKQSEKAIEAAEQAIDTGPNGYAKPYLNIANAYQQLGDTDKALEASRTALRLAEEPQDKDLANKLCEGLEMQAEGDVHIDTEDIEEIIKNLLSSSKAKAIEEAELQSGTIDQVVYGAFKRYPIAQYKVTQEFIPFVRELLADFSPDYCFQVFIGTQDTHQLNILPHCMRACMYLSCKVKGAMQKDAVRVLSIFVLSGVELARVQDIYRKVIMGVSHAATDELNKLETYVKEDLTKMDPLLAERISDQAALSKNEIEHAQHTEIAKIMQKPDLGKQVQDDYRKGMQASMNDNSLHTGRRPDKSESSRISLIPMLFILFIIGQIGIGAYQYFVGSSEVYSQVFNNEKIISHLESILPKLEIPNKFEIIKYKKTSYPGEYLGYTSKDFFYSQGEESRVIPFAKIIAIKTSIWGVYKDIKIIIKTNNGTKVEEKVLFLPRFDKATQLFFRDLESFSSKKYDHIDVSFKLFGFF